MSIVENEGNVLDVPDDVSVACVIPGDLDMDEGVAAQFKAKFGKMDKLKVQNTQTGGLAVLTFGTEEQPRFVYYLVAKYKKAVKPGIKDLEWCLEELRRHMLRNNIFKVAMPKIATGSNGFEWDQVKGMIERAFKDSQIEIQVYNYNP